MRALRRFDDFTRSNCCRISAIHSVQSVLGPFIRFCSVCDHSQRSQLHSRDIDEICSQRTFKRAFELCHE